MIKIVTPQQQHSDYLMTTQWLYSGCLMTKMVITLWLYNDYIQCLHDECYIGKVTFCRLYND